MTQGEDQRADRPAPTPPAAASRPEPERPENPTAQSPARAIATPEPAALLESDIPWRRLLLETVVIIFSVLLALVLDDWRTSRDERQLVKSVSYSLLVELERNQRLLEALLPYHEGMQERLVAYLEGPPASGGMPSLEALGFEAELGTAPAFSRGAWETAVASESLTHMSVERVFVLSTAYTMQEDTTRALARLATHQDAYLVAQLEGERPASAARGYLLALDGALTSERNLCDQYRIVSRHLTAREPSAANRCGSGAVTVT